MWRGNRNPEVRSEGKRLSTEVPTEGLKNTWSRYGGPCLTFPACLQTPCEFIHPFILLYLNIAECNVCCASITCCNLANASINDAKILQFSSRQDFFLLSAWCNTLSPTPANETTPTTWLIQWPYDISKPIARSISLSIAIDSDSWWHP